MSLQWTGLLQCVSGTAAVTLLLRFVFGYVPRARRPALWTAVCAAAVVQAGMLILSRGDPDTADLLQEAMNLICALAFPYIALRFRRRRTFFLFGLVCCATEDYLVSFVPARLENAAYICVDALLCLLTLWMRKTKKTAPPDFLECLPVWIYMTVFAAEWSAFYSGMLTRDTSYYASVSTALKLLAFVLVGGSAVLIARRFLAAQRAEQEAREQLAAQLRHYEQLVEKNRDIRVFRHDYMNNLLSIGAILDAGETEDARAYVRHLQGDAESTAYTYTTGNYLADAILADKDASAERNAIRITFTGTVPEKGIDNTDLCTVLCNLIDNAIRGCTPCAPCTVELDGRESADRWLLTVKNPVVEKVDVRGGTIRTSKADKENHGLGLANVRRAAEKYRGYLELDCSDRCFTAEVGWILNTEENK